MLSGMSGKAISAKAAAMYGKRLMPDDFSVLARKQSVAEISGYLLHDTAYSEALAGIRESLIHRGQLETLLRKELFFRYYHLCIYDFSGNDSFFRYLYGKAEIDQILLILKLINAGNTSKYILSLPAYFMDNASFDLMELTKVTTFNELIHALLQTPYAAVLKPFRPREGEHIDIPACETAMLRFYYERLFTFIAKHFGGSQRKSLEKLFFMQAELINLSTIYRLKEYYSKSPAEIKTHIYPYYYRLSKQRLNALTETPDGASFIKELKTTGYREYLSDSEFIEHFTERALYQMCRRLMRTTVYPSVALVCYMILLQTEVDNIIYIIEGVRYGMPPAEIEKLLIL